MGKVADRRAAAKKAGQSMKEYKASNPSPSPRPRPSRPSPRPSSRPAPRPSRPSPRPAPRPAPSSRMSVADRRAAAKSSGMSMRDYKAANPQSGGAPNRGAAQQNVNNASDYNYDKFRQGQVNNAELLAMRQKGLSRQEIAESARASGKTIGGAAQRRMDRWATKGGKPNTSNTAPETPVVDTVDEPDYFGKPIQPTTPTRPSPSPGGGGGGFQPSDTTLPTFEPPGFGGGNPFQPPTMPTFGGGGNPFQPPTMDFDGSFGVGGDLTQTIGKVGDMTTTIGDNNTIGPGSSIGNDYSVTIGHNHAGNNNNVGGVGATGGYGGGPFGGNSNPLSAMQGAAAYGALNDNAWAKSQSQVNGYATAAAGIQMGEQATGAMNRVASLYNLAGQSQNYWNNKATAQQGFYLGDMFNYRAPGWTMPPDPVKPEDNTQEIADSLDDDDDD